MTTHLVILTKSRAFVMAETSLRGIELDEGEREVHRGEKGECLAVANGFNKSLTIKEWAQRQFTGT